MTRTHKKYLSALCAAVFAVVLVYSIQLISQMPRKNAKEHIKAGFVFDGDASTPYTENFINAMEDAEREFGGRVEVVSKNNVPYSETENVLRELAGAGCDVIFTTSYGYGETAKRLAAEYPDIQFCQATCGNANTEPVYQNYHTFMGEIYEGRYIAGKVAGRKMREMIDSGVLDENAAWIGYVAAYPNAEVISGYTAFFLGARSECPTAMMRVKYVNAWTSYVLEKTAAEELISEGCVIISQHSDTIAPAVVCENTSEEHKAYHVGYNSDMIDVAPTSSLISTKIEWLPYINSAIEAVLEGVPIEDHIDAHIHGNDAGAGFDRGWVRMLDLNGIIAAEGTEKMIEDAENAFKSGTVKVFYGDYIGVDPDDENNTIDLKNGYDENKYASAPGFKYVLKDVIVIE